MAFQAGDVKLGQALHDVHLKTSKEQRLAKTQQGMMQEDAFRQAKDLLLAVKADPSLLESARGLMLASAKSANATDLVAQVQNTKLEDVDGLISLYEALLSDPDNYVVTKQGDAVFNKMTGTEVYSNRASKLVGQGEDLVGAGGNLLHRNPKDNSIEKQKLRRSILESDREWNRKLKRDGLEDKLKAETAKRAQQKASIEQRLREARTSVDFERLRLDVQRYNQQQSDYGGERFELGSIQGGTSQPFGGAAPEQPQTSQVQSGQIQEGAKAFNPETNETIIFKNGQWVPE